MAIRVLMDFDCTCGAWTWPGQSLSTDECTWMLGVRVVTYCGPSILTVSGKHYTLPKDTPQWNGIYCITSASMRRDLRIQVVRRHWNWMEDELIIHGFSPAQRDEFWGRFDTSGYNLPCRLDIAISAYFGDQPLESSGPVPSAPPKIPAPPVIPAPPPVPTTPPEIPVPTVIPAPPHI